MLIRSPHLAAMATAVLVAACAAPDTLLIADTSEARATRVEYGVVEAIHVYRNEDNQPVNVGTILGGLAGGVIGHQIGGGSGNTAATIGGAVVGAVVGNEVHKNQVEGSRYRITVALESGARLSIEDTREMNLRVGDRVRVENNRIYRE